MDTLLLENINAVSNNMSEYLLKLCFELLVFTNWVPPISGII